MKNFLPLAYFEPLMNVGNREETYPPTDILRIRNESYKIVFALAGWTIDQISITIVEDSIVVEGTKTETLQEDPDIQYQHIGISKRPWTRTFRIGKLVDSKNIRASLKDGLLTIDVPLFDRDQVNKKIEIQRVE